MANEKNNQPKMEIPYDTVLNPEYTMTAFFHKNQLLEDDSVFAGDSVKEHTVMEEANEYLADKEIGQINQNLS